MKAYENLEFFCYSRLKQLRKKYPDNPDIEQFYQDLLRMLNANRVSSALTAQLYILSDGEEDDIEPVTAERLAEIYKMALATVTSRCQSK